MLQNQDARQSTVPWVLLRDDDTDHQNTVNNLTGALDQVLGSMSEWPDFQRQKAMEDCENKHNSEHNAHNGWQ